MNEISVLDRGAVPDGRTDCTAAFAAAIAACAADGGGRVLVPAGRYRTGAIHLTDDIDLHLAEGAVIEFSRDPADFLPVVLTRYEGIDLYNYSPFIYAHGAHRVAITGSGVIDGRADAEHWWNWSSGPPPDEWDAKRRLLDAGARGVPVTERVFGDGHHLRPGLVQFVSCTDVRIDGVTLRNSPMWTIHPVLCTGVMITNVRVESLGPNNDGCNPESCTDVVIRGCHFDTGDDCIAIKSGKEVRRSADGGRGGVPSRDILIEDCVMQAGHGGVTIGSEVSGGVEGVIVRRCTMDSPDLKRGLRIKSNPERGGYVSDVHYSDIEIGIVAQAAIEIALDYGNVTQGDHPTPVSEITIERLRVGKAQRALRLIGTADNPISGVHLIDCHVDQVAEPDQISHVIGLTRMDG